LSLHNITLTPLLREEIIVTQKNDEGMTHLRKRLIEGDPKVKCIHEDAEGNLMVQGLNRSAEERSTQEDSG
jgi:hypothetical protein